MTLPATQPLIEQKPHVQTLPDILDQIRRVWIWMLAAASLGLAITAGWQLQVNRLYVSQATVEISAENAAVLRSSELWQNAGMTDIPSSFDVRRTRITTGSDIGISWYQIQLGAPEAAAAQQYLNNILAVLEQMTTLNSQDTLFMERRREALLAERLQLNSFLEMVLARAKQAPDLVDPNVTPKLIADLTELIELADIRLNRLEAHTLGFTPENIVERPSLPTSNSPPNLLRNALLASIASAYLVLVLGLIREAIRRTAGFPR